MSTLLQSVMVKKGLSRNWSIHIPTLTYSHKVWITTDRIKFWIQAAEIGFLHRMVGSAVAIRGEFRLEPLFSCIERSELRWFWYLLRMPPGYIFQEVFWNACLTGWRPQQTQNLLEVYTLFGLGGSTLRVCLGRGMSRSPAWTCCLLDSVLDKL